MGPWSQQCVSPNHKLTWVEFDALVESTLVCYRIYYSVYVMLVLIPVYKIVKHGHSFMWSEAFFLRDSKAFKIESIASGIVVWVLANTRSIMPVDSSFPILQKCCNKHSLVKKWAHFLYSKIFVDNTSHSKLKALPSDHCYKSYMKTKEYHQYAAIHKGLK